MGNRQEFALLIDEITAKTVEFLSQNNPCVDEEGVLHPLFEDILQKRDEAVELAAKFPEAKTILRDAVAFQKTSEILGQYMIQEFESIQDAIKKRNQAKQFSRSYGNAYQPHKPLFFNDLG